MWKNSRPSAGGPVSHRLDKNTKAVQEFCDDPLIIPQDADDAEESSPATDNNPWPMFILIGGSIVLLLCVWWFAPNLLINLFKQNP
jgi:hypothetical protein